MQDPATRSSSRRRNQVGSLEVAKDRERNLQAGSLKEPPFLSGHGWPWGEDLACHLLLQLSGCSSILPDSF